MKKLGRPSPYNASEPATSPVATTTTQPTIENKPVPATHTQQVSKNTSPSHNSNTVLKMQQELLNIYTILKSKPELAEWFSKDHEPQPGQEGFDKGANSFLQFMLHRYVNKAQTQGEQYNLTLPDAKSYNTPGHQLPKSSFLQYLEMLRIFGAHQTTDKAKNPDGTWGTYTNNALKAVWSIAYTMVSLSTELNDRLDFTSGDLDKLAANIPNALTGISGQELEKRAENILPLLQKLEKSSHEFINMMSDASHQYSQYISGNKNFNVLTGQANSLLSRKDRGYAAGNSKKELPNILVPQDLNSAPTPNDNSITLGDLISPDALKKFLIDKGIFIGDNDKIDWNNPKNLELVVNYLKKEISDAAKNSQLTTGTPMNQEAR